MYRSMYAAIIFGVALAISMVPPASAEEPVMSNLQLMTDMSHAAAVDIVDRVAPQLLGRSVRLKPFGTGEEYQLITNVMTAVLTERGIVTFPASAPGRPSPPEANDALVVEYQALEFSLDYAKVYRSHLIGGKKVKREGAVRILTTVLDGDGGSVLWVGDAGRDHADQFSYGDVDRIEQGTFAFTQPPIPGSGWGKVVEPVFVTGIVVGLIYLFFSNQSDS